MYNPFRKKVVEPQVVMHAMDWVDASVELPNPKEVFREYLICHYNDFTEVARYDGDWHAITSRISDPDEKLSKEGQPSYWLLIYKPDRSN